MHPALQAARDVLLQACLELQQRGAAATPALLSALRLVHSYLLVRTLVRQGDHQAAARLLLVVAVSRGGFCGRASCGGSLGKPAWGMVARMLSPPQA